MFPFVVIPLVLVAPSASESLHIDQVTAAYGLMQPERTSHVYYPPHDNLIFRFRLTGLTVKDGQIDVETTIKLIDERGKVIRLKSSPFQGTPLIASGGPLHYYAHLPLNEPLPNGKYTAEVTVTDNPTQGSATFTRRIVFKDDEFAVVEMLFARDPEGRVPAPAKAVVGERLFYQLNAIGFDVSQQRVEVSQKLEVIDVVTGEALPKTFETGVLSPNVIPGGRVTFNGNTGVLLHPGRYLLRYELTDHIGNASIRFETPFEVMAP
jgi:hypothetical protein